MSEMIVKTYTDDGYKTSRLSEIMPNINTVKLLEVLYFKGVLASDDIDIVLPIGYTVARAET